MTARTPRFVPSRLPPGDEAANELCYHAWVTARDDRSNPRENVK